MCPHIGSHLRLHLHSSWQAHTSRGPQADRFERRLMVTWRRLGATLNRAGVLALGGASGAPNGYTERNRAGPRLSVSLTVVSSRQDDRTRAQARSRADSAKWKKLRPAADRLSMLVTGPGCEPPTERQMAWNQSHYRSPGWRQSLACQTSPIGYFSVCSFHGLEFPIEGCSELALRIRRRPYDAQRGGSAVACGRISIAYTASLTASLYVG